MVQRNVTSPNLELVAPNVSSVPIYSPFRYPGGKSRLYPFMVQWLASSCLKKVSCLVEPFAGAAHVGLAAAIEQWSTNVVLIELDNDIACVWKTVLSDNCLWLVDRIQSFILTQESADEILANDCTSTREHAFKVILKNRLSRGGISAPGSGLLEKGENGRGISSRWYPQTLVRRIQQIHKASSRILFLEGDGLSYIDRWANDEDKVYFIDPPYPEAGRRLYRHFDVQPETVFRLVSNIKSKFVVTYNDSSEIHELAKAYDLEIRRILMRTAHHEKKFELLISNDFSWLKK